MTDAGSSLIEKAREKRRRFAWSNKWVIALLVGVVAGITLIEWLVARRLTPWLAQAWIGAGAVAIVWSVSELLRSDGAQHLRDGATGEKQTSGALRRYASTEWDAFHDIPLKGRNIDHALVGPRGAVALDSKFTNHEWLVTESGIERIKLNGKTEPVPKPLRDARARAKDLHSVILAKPAQVRTQVLPVVVLWGNVQPVSGGALVVDDVLIAVGSQAAEWVPGLAGEPLTPAEVNRAQDGVATRKREHRSAA